MREEANRVDSKGNLLAYAPLMAKRPEKVGLAKLVAETRKSLGFKDALALAKESGVSRARIAQIESGDYKDVKLSTLELLAKALRREVEELVAAALTPPDRPALEKLLLRFRTSYWNVEWLRSSKEGVAKPDEIEEIRNRPPPLVLAAGATEETVAKLIDAARSARRR